MPESLHLLLIGRLGHLEDQRRLTKPEILRGDVTVQEDVDTWRKDAGRSGHALGPLSDSDIKDKYHHLFLHTFTEVWCNNVFTLSDAEGHGNDSIGARDSVQTADEVRQVVQHAQIVLHHDDVPATQHHV